MFRSPSVGAMAVAACIIHELGHCFAAVILNVKIKVVKFWAGGVLIKREERIVSLSHEIVILLFGPLFNVIFAVFYAYCGRYEAAVLGIAFAVFNLLPCRTLDGGSVLSLILERRMKFGAVIQKTICVTIGIATVLFMLVTGIGGAVTVCAVAVMTISEASE